jgi:hypothetical protein
MSGDNCVPGTDIPKPEVHVPNGNAISVMTSVRTALHRARVPQDVIDAFQKKCLSGDYDNVLLTAMEYAELV